MTIKENLQKANERVEKRFNIIKKLCKKVNINFDDLIEKYHFEINNDFEPYYLTNLKRNNIIKDFNLNEEISYEFDENLYKLYEVERIANNWEIKYQKEQNKLNAEKISDIWNFLTEWEEKTINWYKENSKKYLELKENEKENFNIYKISDKGKKDYEIICKYHKYSKDYYFESEWKKEYYSNISVFTKQITNCYYKTIDEELLNKTIAKEKLDKYFNLIEKVTKIVGEITNASYLSIGNQKGELNGIITGSKGKCRIETISAGGYNIQCFHYRVLIHKIL